MVAARPSEGVPRRPDVATIAPLPWPVSGRLPMSLAIVHSRALDGLKAPEVTVEVHLANGLPSFTIVGR